MAIETGRFFSRIPSVEQVQLGYTHTLLSLPYSPVTAPPPPRHNNQSHAVSGNTFPTGRVRAVSCNCEEVCRWSESRSASAELLQVSPWGQIPNKIFGLTLQNPNFAVQLVYELIMFSLSQRCVVFASAVPMCYHC